MIINSLSLFSKSLMTFMTNDFHDCPVRQLSCDKKMKMCLFDTPSFWDLLDAARRVELRLLDAVRRISSRSGELRMNSGSPFA